MPGLRKLLLLLTFLPALAWPVEQFTVTVVDKKPQSRDNFVQGLEILDEHLYVSTGGYGSSRLLRYHFADGRLDKGGKLRRDIFAEEFGAASMIRRASARWSASADSGARSSSSGGRTSRPVVVS